MVYTVVLDRLIRETKVVVVGCGGTGGFVADGLCRLLANSELPLLLVDPDRVEPHNLRRQNFFSGDVGKFKSQVLAERLARQYGRSVGYSVFPFDRDLINEPTSLGMRQISGFIIGCVDNPAARRTIAGSIGHDDCWLDAGNGRHSGQVLIGNAKTVEELAEGFKEDSHKVSHLPIPSLQLPSLLAPPTEPQRPQDCAEAIEADEQSPVINQAMATLVLTFMHKLFTNSLTWMGAYIDLEVGRLNTVPAEPLTVARMFGIKVNTLMANKCALGARYHV